MSRMRSSRRRSRRWIRLRLNVHCWAMLLAMRMQDGRAGERKKTRQPSPPTQPVAPVQRVVTRSKTQLGNMNGVESVSAVDRACHESYRPLMPSSQRAAGAAYPAPSSPSSSRVVSVTLSRAAAVLFVVGVFACGSDEITFPKEVELSQIAVDSTANTMELGSRMTFTATAKDKKGKVVDVPVTWRSSNEKLAVFERGGVLYARDTGQVFVAAASLGVGSPAISIQIVWLGPAHVASGTWAKPVAVNPGATISDSLRVVVTNSRGQPVAN